ncbi:MAG: ROK family protein [Chloroflexota bacterium]|nr:ROK family protein [Chloroflexota bacterium]
MHVLGIDIGGTGIKGAPVDIASGTLMAERIRLITPDPSTPEACAEIISTIAQEFRWQGRIGCGYPGVVKNGITITAANVDAGWINADAKSIIEHATQCKTSIMNDADAAGLAEIRFGAGRDVKGVVMMVTLGTGIGTALFVDGKLVPNLEFGHLIIRGKDAETRASERARIKKDMSWRQWAARLDEYLTYVENLFWPDLFIVGGGASKNHEKFIPYLTIRTPIVPAQMFNDAGIVGAALAGMELAIDHPK